MAVNNDWTKLAESNRELLEMCKTIDTLMACRFWMDNKEWANIRWDGVRRILQNAIANAERE